VDSKADLRCNFSPLQKVDFSKASSKNPERMLRCGMALQRWARGWPVMGLLGAVFPVVLAFAPEAVDAQTAQFRYAIATLGGGFQEPGGVALDASGNVYVADYGNGTVKKIPAGCTSSACVTGMGGGFSQPVGVSVSASGNVYIADSGNNAVKEMAPGCSSSACVSTVGGGFHEPYGVTLDSSGNLYVADFGNNAVKKMASSCGSWACVSTLGGGFLYPVGIAVGANGNVYVGDAGNNAVKQMAAGCSSSACVSTIGGGFNEPAGLALDGSGNLYVADYGNSLVKKMASGCGSSSCVGTLGGGFSFPLGVTVDASGNVYVADSKNAVMKEIPSGCSSSSCVKTLAGGFQVSQQDPFGLAVDGSGKVYFSDGALYAIPPGCTSTSCVVEMGTSSMTPYGLAADGNGNVYIADGAHSVVWEISAGCTLNSCTPASLGGGFNQPHGVAVDASGNIYVADTGNSAVKEMPAGCGSSSCVTNLGGGFSQPYGVAVDASGDVYVADFGNNAVKQMPAGCASSSCVTTAASGFSGVGDVALDGKGNIYWSDNGNSAVKAMGRATPPSLSFASTQAGQTSSNSPQTVTVQNIGNATLNLSGLSYSADFPEAAGVGTDCTSTTQLGLGISCTLSIDFSPLVASLTSASTFLSESTIVTDNALNVTQTTQTVGVSGTATAPPVTQLAFGTPPAALISVGGNAGSAITVQEEISTGTVATWTTDTITLKVTYPDASVHTYTRNAVQGVATFNLSGVALTETGAYLYTGSLSGASSVVASEVVGTAIMPTITWSPATTIVFGSAGLNVLNASVNCIACGTVGYTETPSGGGTAVAITSTTGLAAGSYTIAAIFVPGNSGYLGTSKTQPLTVSGESVWIVNHGGGVSELAGNGYAITSGADAGGSLAAAIDANGNVWSLGSGTTLLESVSQTGIVQHSIGSGGGLSGPSNLAIDGNSEIWVTNAGNNSFSLFLDNGTAASPSTGFTSSSLSHPSGIAVDLGGSVWIANQGNNSLTRVLGAAAPAAPLSTAGKNNTTGTKP
jgi:streptogramin lyase